MVTVNLVMYVFGLAYMHRKEANLGINYQIDIDLKLFGNLF